MVPTPNREQPWLPVNCQAIYVEETRSGPDPVAVGPEFAIYDEVLCDVEYRQHFSEPRADLGVASLDTTRRPVVEMGIVGEDCVEQIPVETVDGRGVTGEEVIHADPIDQCDGSCFHMRTLLRFSPNATADRRVRLRIIGHCAPASANASLARPRVDDSQLGLTGTDASVPGFAVRAASGWGTARKTLSVPTTRMSMAQSFGMSPLTRP